MKTLLAAAVLVAGVITAAEAQAPGWQTITPSGKWEVLQDRSDGGRGLRRFFYSRGRTTKFLGEEVRPGVKEVTRVSTVVLVNYSLLQRGTVSNYSSVMEDVHLDCKDGVQIGARTYFYSHWGGENLVATGDAEGRRTYDPSSYLAELSAIVCTN